jgi:hypothetical protein
MLAVDQDGVVLFMGHDFQEGFHDLGWRNLVRGQVGVSDPDFVERLGFRIHSFRPHPEIHNGANAQTSAFLHKSPRRKFCGAVEAPRVYNGVSSHGRPIAQIPPDTDEEQQDRNQDR